MIRRRADSRRGQRGASLIELVVALGAATVLLVPTLAWTVLAIRQQPETMNGLVRSADTGLLGAYLPEDVAVAGAAARNDDPRPADEVVVPMDDCQGGSGAGGRVVLALLGGGPVEVVRTFYVEAPGSDGGGMSVWRRVCDTGGLNTTEVEVFEDVVTGSTQAACDDDTTCRQVEFRTRPESDTRDVVIAARRRADPASLRVDRTGNRLPVAKIRLVSATPGVPSDATFTAEGSSDPDGSIVAVRWEFATIPDDTPGAPAAVSVEGDGDLTTPQVRTYSQDGRYYVTLTVTDNSGATNTFYRRIDVDPLPPVAVGAVSPTVGTAGETEFTFTGSASSDPDGTVVGFHWVVGTEGAGYSTSSIEPTWSMALPADVSGTLPVSLTVTDAQGLTDTYLTTIVVNSPGGPTTPGPGSEEPPPPVTVPGGPVAAFTATPGSGSADTFLFDASASTDDGEIVAYEWDFGLLAGAGSGASTEHTFPAPGSYLVTLTVTDDVGLVGSLSQFVAVSGAPATPEPPTQDGDTLRWAAVPGARRYLVDFEFTANGCARTLTDQAVGASTQPSKVIPASLCAGSDVVARARYKVEVNGQVAASEWVVVDAPAAAVGG